VITSRLRRGRPRWGQVRRFCQVQGYRETKTDHWYYDKVLPDGSSSGTKVSLAADSDDVPPSLWTPVWRRQLRLTSEEEFWRGLDGSPVQYDIPTTPEPPQPLPPYLDRFLRTVLHYTDAQIAATTRHEAQRMLNEYHARELSQ
jgi:hypothetical protein